MKYLLISLSLSITIWTLGQDIPTTSVLNKGHWMKMKINRDGIYKLTYRQLKEMGINAPERTVIYGNGGAMLPTMNNEKRYWNLQQTSIWFEKGSDTIFNDDTDYILFYAEGTTKWTYNETLKIFEHSLHLYSEENYYFIGEGDLKTIRNFPIITTINEEITHYNDFDFYEQEQFNLLKSGRTWVGERLDKEDFNISFNFPNIDVTQSPILTVSLLARHSQTSYFTISSGSFKAQIDIPPININAIESEHGILKTTTLKLNPSKNDILLQIEYVAPSTGASAWLNYLRVNVVRKLKIDKNQPLAFRNTQFLNTLKTAEYKIENTNINTLIWNVTDPTNIFNLTTNFNNSTTTFIDSVRTLKEYIAFDKMASFPAPEIIGNVENQNLHSLSHIDYIVISPKKFLKQANELADIHRKNDNLNTIVVSPQQIYNEFSSGVPDVSALRDFIRMLYIRSTSKEDQPKYLLLLGDGTYDNKNVSRINPNYILTYQSKNSLSPIASFVSDDFFGLLDQNEGESNGDLDISIGRLPVKNTTEADIIVNKIKQYIHPENFGRWRQKVCFIADDEDANIHTQQANQLADSLIYRNPSFIAEKLFIDNYPAIVETSGKRYPKANEAISYAIESGALIVNYTGHGNEYWLAEERIITKEDINAWYNPHQLPLFITATCEFSRFDNHEIVSAGENILLSPNGGGIGLCTTTRLVYSSPNFDLNKNFYKFFNQKDENGRPLKIGDIMRLAKNETNTLINKRSFTLLGDPALQLSFPNNTIVTDSINHTPVIEGISDTLKALKKITLTGHIEDINGTHKSDFNAHLFITVFDKNNAKETLGNNGATPFKYYDQKNIIFNGKASVKNGQFSISFITPKDIKYNFDKGRIVYYAYNENEEAQGYYDNIIVGGNSNATFKDNTGPNINLYMNNTFFTTGDITDEHPILLAHLKDETGINTTGYGLGHNILGILDEETNTPYILNEFYEANLDNYSSGVVKFQFKNLPPGNHSLYFKAWDLLNNSSTEQIEFIVLKGDKLIIDKVINYPNPFSTSTHFIFKHNQPNVVLQVELTILTLNGQRIRTFITQTQNGSYSSEVITWDGTAHNGQKIAYGSYIFQIIVTTPEGYKEKMSGKILFKP